MSSADETFSALELDQDLFQFQPFMRENGTESFGNERSHIFNLGTHRNGVTAYTSFNQPPAAASIKEDCGRGDWTSERVS